MSLSSDDPGRVGLGDLRRLIAVHRDAARRKALLKKPHLTYFFWESTLRCNLHCLHCGSSCEATSPLKELTTDQIMGILDTIGEDFDCSQIFVSITGGEPLLRPDLFDVVKKMTGLGMGTCIVTNGTLINEERGKRLYDAGMRTVSISVDGPEAVHDAVRGQGSFARTLAGITKAREAGMDWVEAITCVRPANIDLFPEIERIVRDAGANLWRLITIDRMGRLAGKDAPEMWLEPPDIRRLLDFIDQRRSELKAAGEHFDVRFSCGGFLGVRREFSVRPGDGQCFAGLCVGSILADGKVSACPSLPRSWAQGSALEERFSKIWYERFQDFRETAWRRTGPCAKCSWWSVCLGGGLHERLAQPTEFCWLERQID
jgi:radical SAM protein with 4Fe4S-binding SPASM domain